MALKAPSLKGYTFVNTGKNGLIRKGSGVKYKDASQYGKFTYDPMQDVSYQSLAKVYNANGIKAANDTLGSAAALNGGYGSSYAVSASQQARNDYNQQLAALIPDLEQNAYTRWAADRDYDFNVAQARDNQWYQNMGLWMDAIGSNNQAAASTNSDRLNKAGFNLDLAQFKWQKKKAKSSGGGGGGRRGGGYRGYGGNNAPQPDAPKPEKPKGKYAVYVKGKFQGYTDEYKAGQGWNSKTRTGSFRQGNRKANEDKKKK